MNMVEAASTETRPTCADKVQDAWNSRRQDLKAMLDPDWEDLSFSFDNNSHAYALFVGEQSAGVTVTIDALLETLAEIAGSYDIMKMSFVEFEGDLLDHYFDEYEDNIREAAREGFYEYGLAFDYVAPGTFGDQAEGYWRYQISYGGPSEEIRFYASQGHRGWSLHRAEFWYLDWFDGAPIVVTGDEIVEQIWNDFDDCGVVQNELERATEE